MFYLENTETGELAHKDSRGQHDGMTTQSCEQAAAFDTFGEASDYGQNFGDDWNVVQYG